MTAHNPAHTPQNLELAAVYQLPVETVDDAIDYALDKARLEEGWGGIPDLNPLIWHRIGTDVERYLDDHVQQGEAIAA